MAKVVVKSGNVSVEGESQKDVFEVLAQFQEIFGITSCKGCKNDNLRYVFREAPDTKGKTHKYYELRCQNCFAKLSFGQHTDGGTLFPKEWVRWNKETQKEETV